MTKFIFLFGSILTSLTSFAQKKTIDHTAYNEWKKLTHTSLSNDGRYVCYEKVPLKGDGYLYLYDTKNQKTDSFPRAESASFSFKSDYLVFRIKPGYDTLRNCELNKVDKKKWPKDSLGIYLLAADSLIKYPFLESFSVGEKHNWMAWLKTDDQSYTVAATNVKKKKSIKKRKNQEPKDPESDGKLLTVFDPSDDCSFEIFHVSDYTFSEKGNWLAFVQQEKHKKQDSVQLHLMDLPNWTSFPLSEKLTAIQGMTFNHGENEFVYLSGKDSTEKMPYNLNIYRISEKTTYTVDTSTIGIPAGNAVSEHFEPYYTENDRYLFFGVTKIPVPEPKDTLLASEKVKVDIWSYNEPRLQSQQLIELKSDLKKTDLFVLHPEDNSIAQLSNDTLEVYDFSNVKGEYLEARSEEAYALQNQWDFPQLSDVYRVSLRTGNSELIQRAAAFPAGISPSGNYYTWFNAASKNYYLKNFISGDSVCMTCSEKQVNWQEDVNGMPMEAEPLGIIGYTTGEKQVLIRSEFDIWSYSLHDQKLACLTEGKGKKENIRMNLFRFDRDSVYYDLNDVLLVGFDNSTKGNILYSINNKDTESGLTPLFHTDHSIADLGRSKNKKQYYYRLMNVQDYPEITLTTAQFSTATTISKTNPQQKEYNWATVELVKWTSYSGIPLEGLLYKPEDFDSTKKYPLMVYYYELNSDNLNTYYSPRPTASIIYPTEYASAGYLVFIPDIRYTPGHPAKSAYDCIMSGTDHILKLYPNTDSTKMGLQGQSWGGYQTAQLITMTKRYAAAMAGAPVSNMFSAYGGIRWSSGVNRQFQYERTQSRIGKNIWEAPELYIENSPLFHLPNVTTPLLIMANDNDGAVPWYQGIELFNGMKRLEKPCWMLNYNGDQHNLMKEANRMDLSIRMRQFFDHYLQGKPAPKWLSEGIPAIDKGKVMGYE